ncbi:hypothetical protein FE257_010674 [Aspergillus nanangensis]|uniref:Erythromycin esterase n=1 Tax=Aspergillus nanangensis TaxID=2582783 RepID=A0AAD4GT06_ASPNN|nr:hypothetical protein FE257_010674 [Aspergillus nanangensis]
MAVRRSARLRSRQASSEPPADPVVNNDNGNSSQNNNNNNNNNLPAVNKNNNKNGLPKVTERDEPPLIIDAPPAPTHSPSSRIPAIKTPVKPASTQRKTPTTKTPTSVMFRPPHQEMHPSKVHQSTAKKMDSGLILGFNPIPKDADGNVVMTDAVVQDTPTKAKPSPAPTNYGTPGFEFKFACQESQLSDEAKKLMESVREDVAKIKAQMIQNPSERSPQKTYDQQQAERKIAHPKGKTGRFSNVHMTEFKKMDSIAGHASAFRGTPGRFQPVVEKTLKRTNSKARLDESDNNSSPSKSASKPLTTPAPATPSAKRVKYGQADDISTRRPTQVQAPTPKPMLSRPRSAVRSSLMTPTRAAVGRTTSFSVKPPRTTMIPSMLRSPEAKPSAIPRTPQTDFNPRLKSSIPTLGNLRSILRRPQPLFSRDPAKIAAGTHHAAPDFSPSALLMPSCDASEEPAQTPSPKKHVEFASGTESHMEEGPASPSPSKIPMVSRPTSDIVYPSLPTLTPEKSLAKFADDIKSPTVRQVLPSKLSNNNDNSSTSLPEVPGIAHGIGHKKRHREAAETEPDVENMPPVSSNAEGRSAKRVKLGSPSPSKIPPTPSPIKRQSQTPLRSASTVNRSRTPASARLKSRSMLSMSRLNMLAQPKNRP